MLIAGNWKMNGSRAALDELRAVAAAVQAGEAGDLELLLCPPATLISAAREILPASVGVGGQDCHANEKGAHTGDVAAEMLADVGATFVITGHSERRADHRESDEAVRAKAEAARRAGLVPVICVGETKAQRDEGSTLVVLGEQLTGSLSDDADDTNTVIAYEPVWAIGTGDTATPEDVAEVHAFLRKQVELRFGSRIADGMRILYGGSVKPSNAAELMGVADVDGALVGGASLKATDFLAICKAARGV